jgi:uncharacterized protein (TIGR02453 family)
MTDFKGFPKDFFQFFKELAKNNERPWFEENKERYKASVVAPMSDFITAMSPRLAKMSKHFVADPRPNGGSMFRIYRDVRFAKDKRPYKEHASCHFRQAGGKDVHAPGFYMHFAPDEVLFGGGMWMPEPESLNKIRQSIAGDTKAWRKVVEDKGFKAAFKEVHGDALSRPPRGFDPANPYIEDIKRKSFFAMHESTPKATQSAKLLDDVEATFRAAKPLMKFLCDAVGAPY